VEDEVARPFTTASMTTVVQTEQVAGRVVVAPHLTDIPALLPVAVLEQQAKAITDLALAMTLRLAQAVAQVAQATAQLLVQALQIQYLDRQPLMLLAVRTISTMFPSMVRLIPAMAVMVLD
jgi:hypothetical protein